MKKLIAIEDRPVLVHYKEIEINGNNVLTVCNIELLKDKTFIQTFSAAKRLKLSKKEKTHGGNAE